MHSLIVLTGNEHARVEDRAGRLRGYRAVLEPTAQGARLSRRGWPKARQAAEYGREVRSRLRSLRAHAFVAMETPEFAGDYYRAVLDEMIAEGL